MSDRNDLLCVSFSQRVVLKFVKQRGDACEGY